MQVATPAAPVLGDTLGRWDAHGLAPALGVTLGRPSNPFLPDGQVELRSLIGGECLG